MALPATAAEQPAKIENIPVAEPRETVALIRNYRPAGDYEVVGWHKPEVKRKNAAGVEIIVEPAEFIKGEKAPPVISGTGYEHKIWAGTVLKVGRNEAKNIVRIGIARLEFAD